MDDMTTITTTKACTKWLLDKLQENISWAQMEVKPSKSRSISIVKGRLTNDRFCIKAEPIPTVREKPIKNLGRWYTADLKDAEPVEQLRDAAPTVATGRKRNPTTAVGDANPALRHKDIVGQVQHDRGGLGLASTTPTWRKATPKEQRHLVVEEVSHQEEATSRYLHRTESTPCEGNKRYRSRSPLTRSDQEDEARKSSDRFPEPLSKPSQSKRESVFTPLSFELQASPVSSSKCDRVKKRGSTGLSQKGCAPERKKRPCSSFSSQRAVPQKRKVAYLQGPKLGEGGFGTVYAGTRISDGLQVAIKYVSKELAKKEHLSILQGSIPLEVALLLHVSAPPACPNIVRLLEWFEQPKHYALILERPDPCEDLVEFSNRSEDTDEEMAKDVILQLINALKHCESRGVLHRDVKPENILVCTDTREVKLLDFGCGDFLMSNYKNFAGTIVYAPPELFHFRRYHAGPTTVWSVGITLYEILSGSVPFSGIMEIIKNEPVLPDFLSKECRHLLQWCLDKNPDNRPSLEDIERHPWFQ
ncbi:serine/threonine-protein kinase pim-1-like [Triplophysa rosa]|uniref:serine/threonine-protein kinase pim-1-like n=1 Tax=Triplophysa rosa TaxID=992332 RepID=UPI0025460012|nr:serine/threonine-protein kinase pim-1-like [Triplophysa rosa]